MIMIALADIAMALKMIYFAIVLLSKQSSGCNVSFFKENRKYILVDFLFFQSETGPIFGSNGLFNFFGEGNDLYQKPCVKGRPMEQDSD